MKSEKLKPAYKQTDVGIIPADWKVKKLAEIGEIITGSTPPTHIKDYWNGDIPWITPTDISTSRDISHSEREITSYGLRVTRKLPTNSVLITCIASIGKNAILKKEGACNQQINAIVPNSGNNSNFIYYLIENNKKYLLSKAGITATNIISKKVFSEILFSFPPLTEQTAIASVISDADASIEAIKALIAKKRDLKQGAMQELLTGKKRLPGFTSKWETKKFALVCWFQEGPGIRNWQFTKDGMKVINVTNLENGILNLESTDRYISMQEFNKMYQHFDIDDKDIVMASSGNSYAKVAVVRKQDLPLMMNTSVIRFKPLKDLDYYFLLAFLKSNIFKKQIDLLITGGAQPNFGPAHLKKIEIEIPSTKAEQNDIAQILSDMDKEIESLEQKLDKYKMIKQGMMQELLNGKMRLI